MLDYSREFIVLVKCLNYTTAAQRLNISQPSLSRHIVSLEKAIGFQLFKRNPLALTAAGKYYMESISTVLESFDAIVDQGKRLTQEESAAFSIYMPPGKSPWSSIVYESIVQISSDQTCISPLVYYYDRTNSVYEAVLNGKADVGILLSEPASVPEGFECEWLIDVPFHAWVHENNPVLKLRHIEFSDLADSSLVSSTNQTSRTWLDFMISAYHEHGMKPKVHLRDIDDLASFYLTLGPDEVILVTDEGEKICPYNPRLVAIRFNNPQLLYSSYLFHKSPSKKPVVKEFVKTCHSVAETIRP